MEAIIGYLISQWSGILHVLCSDLFNKPVNYSDSVAWINCMMEKNELETVGRNRPLSNFNVLSRYLLGETEKSHERSQSGELVFRSGFELFHTGSPHSSRIILSRGVNRDGV